MTKRSSPSYFAPHMIDDGWTAIDPRCIAPSFQIAFTFYHFRFYLLIHLLARSSTERSAITEHFQFETLLRPPPSRHCRCFIGSTMERAAAIVPSFSITGRPAVAATVIFNGFLRRGEFVSPASSNNRPERLLNSYVIGSFKLIYSL